MDDSTTKRCTRCGLEKPLAEFTVNRVSPDGLAYNCRECQRAYASATYAKNAEHRRSYAREWHAKHPEGSRNRSRQNYITNGDQRRAYVKQHYQANADRLKTKHKEWRKANRERDNEIVYRSNRRNIVNVRIRGKVYHALRKGAQGKFTPAEWRAMCDWFGNVCLKCGASGALTVDHVLPIVRGGSNYIDNLQPLCKSCNCSKQAKHIDYRDPVQLAAFLASLR